MEWYSSLTKDDDVILGGDVSIAGQGSVMAAHLYTINSSVHFFRPKKEGS